MKIGVYLNTAGGGVDYHKQTWVKAFAEGVNTLNPEHSATLIEQHEPVAEYEYSFCFSYQGEMFKPTNKMSLLRRALQEKHLEDGKILEKGTYKSLLAKKGCFYKMHESGIK